MARTGGATKAKATGSWAGSLMSKIWGASEPASDADQTGSQPPASLLSAPAVLDSAYAAAAPTTPTRAGAGAASAGRRTSHPRVSPVQSPSTPGSRHHASPHAAGATSPPRRVRATPQRAAPATPGGGTPTVAVPVPVSPSAMGGADRSPPSSSPRPLNSPARRLSMPSTGGAAAGGGAAGFLTQASRGGAGAGMDEEDDEDATTAVARHSVAAADAAAAAAAAAAAMGESDSDDAEYSIDEFDPYLFMKMLPPHSVAVPVPPPVALPPKAAGSPPITLVLDLDETLVHCNIEPVADPDIQFKVQFGGHDYHVFVHKRPHMDAFLRAIAGKFEVVVFTASQRVYAEKLLDLIDPTGTIIQHRLYREACVMYEQNLLKDLSVLGRDLRKTVIVDNSPHAFSFHVDNGIPIESWFDDKHDEELPRLLPFLRQLQTAADVRPLVREEFKVQERINASGSWLRR